MIIPVEIGAYAILDDREKIVAVNTEIQQSIIHYFSMDNLIKHRDQLVN
ncbi:hypothetical protein LZQ00_15305 [Sphingobacterium sp. SRCM116780]|nr:hypothetical protein [Sphingobacterium sp. SRCM116780]UIR55624.1 hypothetical protein LZQ00_15305 [Sphingobacterium sp. SRCM116780]